MKTLRFFKCKHCGNVIVKLIDKNVRVFCCGEPMEEIFANTIDAATEKHLPIVNVDNGFVNVTIGSVEHPMEQEHFINFIVVQTQENYIISTLRPQQKPQTKVYVGNSKVVAVYEYCNLHGLWVTKL